MIKRFRIYACGLLAVLIAMPLTSEVFGQTSEELAEAFNTGFDIGESTAGATSGGAA